MSCRKARMEARRPRRSCSSEKPCGLWLGWSQWGRLRSGWPHILSLLKGSWKSSIPVSGDLRRADVLLPIWVPRQVLCFHVILTSGFAYWTGLGALGGETLYILCKDTVVNWRNNLPSFKGRRDTILLSTDTELRWHHQLNEHELERALGDWRTGKLGMLLPPGCKELDTT